MKFKLDENFGARTQHLFQEAGHEVETVFVEVGRVRIHQSDAENSGDV